MMNVQGHFLVKISDEADSSSPLLKALIGNSRTAERGEQRF